MTLSNSIEPVDQDRRNWLRAAAAAGSGVAPLGLSACSSKKAKQDSLVVGGLPVTCNLTLPVACMAKAASNAAEKSGRVFEF